MNFILKKNLNQDRFISYLEQAQITNQFTNGGVAVKNLEARARDLLKINESKAIIATCNGAAAISAILGTLLNSFSIDSIQSQDFTFPCNFQLPGKHTEAIDIDKNQQIVIESFKPNSVIIVTNCFGHLQNIDEIVQAANKLNSYIVFDNAASPYSFWKGSNSCNYGIASYISLHHTKPIGFGEGGLIIIDKVYEELARAIINFGKYNGSQLYYGNNYKMSELSAAGILQWWDSFNIDDLSAKFRLNYRKQASKYTSIDSGYTLFNNYAAENDFFPNCLPIIKISDNIKDIEDPEVRRYYQPWVGLYNSAKLYNRIQCVPIT